MAGAGKGGGGAGAYVPPHQLKRAMAGERDRGGEAYQRLAWDALRKSLNGLVNKVTRGNLRDLLPELFAENLIRGRGLLCRAVMRSQAASPAFTPVYVALVAVVNTKFPEVGELLLHRTVVQFRRAYQRNDKAVCSGSVRLIAHLVNQQLAHELLALELLALLLERPSDDSVELAVQFTKEVGQTLTEVSPRGLHSIFERFRGILHEGEIGKRAQYMIEGLFALRKDSFRGHPMVPEDLDLVDADDQITHETSLDDNVKAEAQLDAFAVDPDFLAHEEAYENIKKEILGDDDESSEEEEEEEGDEDGSEEAAAAAAFGANGAAAAEAAAPQKPREKVKIQDQTETNLVNLRRTIYLTIMSSLDFEEAGHKLMKIRLPAGQEIELCTMIIECCSQERSYIRYYGLLGQRFCEIKRLYQDLFMECFEKQYQLIHRLETNKLRNVAKFFAHLLSTEALPWAVLHCITLTEEETTSSSRIFIKVLFQELCELMGLRKLNKRLQHKDSTKAGDFDGIFPKDLPRNVRFSINFFTSIGLGGITDAMREFLKAMPKVQPKPPPPPPSPSKSGGSSYSYSYSYSDSGSYSYSYSSYSYSYSSYSRSRSRSPSPGARRKRARSRTPESPKRGAGPGGREDRGNGRGSQSPPPSRRRRSPSPERQRRRGPAREGAAPSGKDDGIEFL